MCKCGSVRILSVSGKTSDLFNCNYNGKSYSGYVPEDIVIGDGGYGDYINFDLCLNCGKIQGKFPVTEKAIDNIGWEE